MHVTEMKESSKQISNALRTKTTAHTFVTKKSVPVDGISFCVPGSQSARGMNINHEKRNLFMNHPTSRSTLCRALYEHMYAFAVHYGQDAAV